MTEVMEQIRQKAHKALDGVYLEVGTNKKNVVSRQAIPLALRQQILDAILSIPEIFIKAPDQSLPEMRVSQSPIEPASVYCGGYNYCKKDMLTPDNGAVFMKVLIKEV